MKFKLCGLLVVMMLVTGCGEQADIASDVKVNTDVKVETNVDVKTDVDVETDTDVTVDVGEAEPYYFTFEGTTIDGEALTSDCFAQSKLTMLNIWATYCGPCIQEMPDLGQIAAEYDRAEFQILGLISDVEEDAKESVKAEAMELIEATGADYPHLLLNEMLYSQLVSGVTGVPTTVFFDSKGEPLGYLVGSQSKEAWEEIINELLAEMQ